MGERVGVIGAGYVGLTSAACFTQLGHQVVCVDNDQSKVDDLVRGEVTIVEPGLTELVRDGLGSGRLRFTTEPPELSDVDFVLLCLPTPEGKDGAADVRVLEEVVATLPGLLRPGCAVVTKSTVPVGTGTRLAELLGRPDLPVVSNPEFLREGHAVEDFLRPDRIVLGSVPENRAAAERVAALYGETNAPVWFTDPASAELAKYASNAFLALKVSYVNVLAELCEHYGADIRDVGRLMGLDSRIGPAFLVPGPGWGGSCLPKDTAALLRTAENAGVDFGILRDAMKANARQRAAVVRKIRLAITGVSDGSLSGTRIGLLGLAFKAGTGDLRESPALAVARELARSGAVLTAYDPGVEAVEPDIVQVVDDPYLVAKDAAALVVLTEWPEFRELDWERLAAATERAVVVDARNLLDPAAVGEAGFTHMGLGTDPNRRTG
ncbi:UDPglucose 6-dehydrogenase [Amycolatopsis lurida]|uniref:UDP-glucose 6-dehydrogenase n=1 Tax=Amycolatopsis lurida NRRL 2430 TaxID=1460371 RepID=A0A2P2FGR8_AMYLU|nr:UDP-glucose/GDP-mannose dehydrogenase family protein [Amycolatopsis lurida]KFU75920.1 UDP glucose 6-dehydrogenase [Amycolatopsis lurida NRRL 2430]SEC50478.1 UDPglucose 6-dehydrogenase [Amycolatopsis lurida]